MANFVIVSVKVGYRLPVLFLSPCCLDMKIVPTSIAFLIAFGAAVAAKDDKALIQELFKQEWKTLKFGFELDGGDYNSWGPYIVLQRIDVDHISLSAIDHKNHRGALPVALKVLNTKDAADLVNELIPFIESAKVETGEKTKIMALPEAERTKVLKDLGFGISEGYLSLELTRTDGSRHRIQDDFDARQPTMNSFIHYLMQKVEANTQPSPKPSGAPTRPTQ